MFNSFSVIQTASVKNRRFHVPQLTFLFPLETPLRLSRMERQFNACQSFAACTYLFTIVSELYDAQVNA